MGGFMKGALVQFMETILIPLPNVIIFQFNPETITHTWTPSQAAPAPPPPQTSSSSSTSSSSTATPATSNPLAVSGNPGESFSFTIQMDANDEIAEGMPVGAALAEVSGIYTRLAALEMLLFPSGGDSSLSNLVGSVGFGSPTPPDTTVPQQQLPTTLFVWGPGRILPVKVTGLTVTEKLYDGLLNPTFAEAQLQLKVLTPEELAHVTGPLADVAKAAYVYMTVARQALALANLANAVESIIGMLPV